MGLFDLFKKKTTDSTFPENELEIALMKAATDASKQQDFYMKLLWSPLIILSAEQTIKENKKSIIPKGAQLKLILLPNGQIPVFSSSNRIYDNNIVGKKPLQILTMQAQDLFSNTKGATYWLNPYSNFSKELNALEIEAIMNGTIFEQKNEHVLKEDTPVQLAQPKIQPKELIEQLNILFKGKIQVRAAYLCLIKWPNKERPHLLVGIDSEGDIIGIANEAGPLSKRYISQDEVIDFIKIEEDNGMSDYLKKIRPFYVRE